MLKAVRFDEKNHKNILDFIQNYHDDRGKLNESEGIRHLMQLGLDSINLPKSLLDFDSMKAELLREILQTFNSQNNNLIDKLDKIQPIYVQTSQMEKTIDKISDKISEKIIEKPKIKKVNTTGNANTLLNNLLDNSNK